MCRLWRLKPAVVACTSGEDFGVAPLEPSDWSAMASLIDTMGPIADLSYRFEFADIAAPYVLRWIVRLAQGI